MSVQCWLSFHDSWVLAVFQRSSTEMWRYYDEWAANEGGVRHRNAGGTVSNYVHGKFKTRKKTQYVFFQMCSNTEFEGIQISRQGYRGLSVTALILLICLILGFQSRWNCKTKWVQLSHLVDCRPLSISKMSYLCVSGKIPGLEQ